MGDAAFARRQSEDKPILLDIGAVWCTGAMSIDAKATKTAKSPKIINGTFVA